MFTYHILKKENFYTQLSKGGDFVKVVISLKDESLGPYFRHAPLANLQAFELHSRPHMFELSHLSWQYIEH